MRTDEFIKKLKNGEFVSNQKGVSHGFITLLFETILPEVVKTTGLFIECEEFRDYKGLSRYHKENSTYEAIVAVFMNLLFDTIVKEAPIPDDITGKDRLAVIEKITNAVVDSISEQMVAAIKGALKDLEVS